MNHRDARKRTAAPMEDRLPPHATEAEQAILGCILMDPTVITVVITEILSEETFYELRHRAIYQTLVGLFDEGIPIDTITVVNKLRGAGKLDEIGGIAYLSSLPDTASSAGNVGTYLEICVEKHQLRLLAAAGAQIVADAMAGEIPVAEQMDAAEHGVLKVSSRTAGRNAVSARVLVNMAMERLLELEQGGTVTGLSSGFIDLDALTGGFHPKEMIVVAARPSVGKSSLILNVADHVAVEQKMPVGILSLEMPAERMMERMISSRARVNLRTLSARNPTDAIKLKKAGNELRSAPLYIDDERGMSILKARAKARRMAVEYGIKILFVDYLQLLSAPDLNKYEGRAQEVSRISSGLFDLAGELEIPVVVVSALNRELDKEKNRGPRLSDLKESGSIEQDADTAVLMHYASEQNASEHSVVVKVRVAKNRYGSTGTFDLIFVKPYTRFENAAREEPTQAEMYP